MKNTFMDLSSFFDEKNSRCAFFCGIGGVGMCGLACMAKDLGYTVSGIDRNRSRNTDLLQEAGISVQIGDFGGTKEKWDFFVYSLAISEEDPAVQYANRHQIPLVSRADFLGYLSARFQTRIAIAGTHGKSTVTGMIAAILTAAGKRPTVLCGAELPGGGVYRQGDNDILVYEACEYRDSFLATDPTIAVLNNLEYDHPDWFCDIEDVKRAFSAFLAKKHLSAVVLNADDKNLSALQISPKIRILQFGEKTGEVRLETLDCDQAEPSFVWSYLGCPAGMVCLQIPGLFNRQNALAAASAAILCGIPTDTICKALSAFPGIGGRMERLGTFGGAEFYADYAHHPTAIRLALETSRKMTKGRIVVLFQPHTYSRTSAFFDRFVQSLRCADHLVILEVYAAREKKNASAGGEVLAKACGGHYVCDLSDAAAYLKKEVRSGDFVLLLGAGRAAEVYRMIAE